MGMMATPSERRLAAQDVVPVALLAGGILITLALFLLVLTAAFRTLNLVETVEADSKALRILETELHELNNILSVSALVAVATGDSTSETRYQSAQTQLDSVIFRAATVLDTVKTGYELNQMRRAHLRRVETEQMAMAAARRGERDAAYRILTGKDYLQRKQAYILSIESALNVLDDRQELSTRLLRRELGRVAVSSGAVLLVSWLVIFGLLRVNRIRRQRTDALREALTQELQIKNEELEQFAHTVSHDLKSPLITIRGFLKWVERDALEGNQQRLRQNLERISEAAVRMEGLVDAVLKLSRAGHAVNLQEEFPLGEVVNEAVEMLQGRISGRGVKIIVAANLPTVFGDRARLLEVILNLVDNAIKFMGDEPQPCVEIGIRPSSENQVVFVRDNGIGVDPRHHTHILGLFSRLNSDVDGCGVGLALVKRIVEKHGGSVWVESEGVGKGSTFCFTLPRKTVKQKTADA
jgi:signal transduction histidine kinase